MMFALGCVQALRCNTNTCPVGVATQDPTLAKGLSVSDKSERVYRYHQATIESFLELLASAGLTHPQQLTPGHIKTRGEHDEVVGLGDIYPVVDRGALLSGDVPERYAKAWERASPDSF
jgi:glutamate synthase-like protein